MSGESSFGWGSKVLKGRYHAPTSNQNSPNGKRANMSGETARERRRRKRCTPGRDSRNLKGTQETPARKEQGWSKGRAGMWRIRPPSTKYCVAGVTMM